MLKVLVALALVLVASSLEAATYYVSPTGTGANCTDYQTLGTAANTIQKGINCMSGAGNTVFVRAGTYNEHLEPGYNGLTMAAGTSWTNKNRIAAYPDGCSPNAPNSCGTPGELVWLQTTTSTPSGNALTLGTVGIIQYVEFDGINIDNSVAAAGAIGGELGVNCYTNGNGANFIRVKNAEFIGNQGSYAPGTGGSHGGGDHIGVFKQGAVQSPSASCPGGHEFQNLKIHGGATNEVGFACCENYSAYGYYVVADNVLIENNEIYDTRMYGIQPNCSGCSPGWSTGLIIRNNYIHDITRSGFPGGSTVGILTGEGFDNALIYNNVVNHAGTGGGYGIYCYDNATNQKIYNNTVYDNSIGIRTASGCSGATIQNNISHNNSGGNYSNIGSGTTEDHNLRIGTDPDFVNAGAGNFHLNSATGPAVNVGLCLGTVTSDKDGVARPQGTGCDIGAYEYLPSGTLPGVPTNFIPLSGATGVDLFPALGFTSTGATAYDFYFSSFSGQSTATFTDLFDRANSTDLGASWTPFTVGYTNAQIMGNRVRSTSTSLDSVEQVVGSFAADQWARIRLTTFGTGIVGAHVILRGQGGGGQVSGYIVGAVKGVSTYRTWIYRFSAGVETLIASEDTTPWVAGDLLEAHIVGNTITVYRNGNTDLRLSATDPAATYSSGGVGIHIFADSIGQVEIDNFEAGDIGPVFVGTFSTALYAPINLIPNTVYYWKAAGRNAQGVTLSSVLSFTTLGTTATPIGVRLRCIHGTANCP